MSEADTKPERDGRAIDGEGPAEQPAPPPASDSEPPAASGRTAEQERDDYLALAQRTQADFENYKRRVVRDVAGARQRGAVELAREFLPALDNLDRAIDHAAKGDPLLKGVRLVREELAAALARAGIEEYSPLGERFDPNLHEAVATRPALEVQAPPGVVLEVYQSGYRAGDSVIRPARVVVSA